MIRREFEDGMGETIVTVQMTYTDYVRLKEFLNTIAEFNFPLDLDTTIASLRRWALESLESIY